MGPGAWLPRPRNPADLARALGASDAVRGGRMGACACTSCTKSHLGSGRAGKRVQVKVNYGMKGGGGGEQGGVEGTAARA